MNSVKEVMISLAIELVGGETSLHSFARVYQSLFFLSREDLSPLLNYDSVTMMVMMMMIAMEIPLTLAT